MRLHVAGWTACLDSVTEQPASIAATLPNLISPSSAHLSRLRVFRRKDGLKSAPKRAIPNSKLAVSHLVPPLPITIEGCYDSCLCRNTLRSGYGLRWRLSSWWIHYDGEIYCHGRRHWQRILYPERSHHARQSVGHPLESRRLTGIRSIPTRAISR